MISTQDPRVERTSPDRGQVAQVQNQDVYVRVERLFWISIM